MSALDDRIAALRQQHASAQADQARAAAQRDLLEAQVRSAFTDLQTNFGVSSVAEAQEMLSDLDKQISAALDAAEQIMGAS